MLPPIISGLPLSFIKLIFGQGQTLQLFFVEWLHKKVTGEDITRYAVLGVALGSNVVIECLGFGSYATVLYSAPDMASTVQGVATLAAMSMISEIIARNLLLHNFSKSCRESGEVNMMLLDSVRLATKLVVTKYPIIAGIIHWLFIKIVQAAMGDKVPASESFEQKIYLILPTVGIYGIVTLLIDAAVLTLQYKFNGQQDSFVDLCARVCTPGGSVLVGGATPPKVPVKHRGHEDSLKEVPSTQLGKFTITVHDWIMFGVGGTAGQFTWLMIRNLKPSVSSGI